uniref:Uncharacterized protein n=1 Tax=Cacopsylla melanoneura TaxID=428564 RepID=A0A8D8XYB6_9HEMI
MFCCIVPGLLTTIFCWLDISTQPRHRPPIASFRRDACTFIIESVSSSSFGISFVFSCFFGFFLSVIESVSSSSSSSTPHLTVQNIVISYYSYANQMYLTSYIRSGI